MFWAVFPSNVAELQFLLFYLEELGKLQLPVPCLKVGQGFGQGSSLIVPATPPFQILTGEASVS